MILKYIGININIDETSVALKNPTYAMKGVDRFRVQRLRLVTSTFAKTLTKLSMYGNLKMAHVSTLMRRRWGVARRNC